MSNADGTSDVNLFNLVSNDDIDWRDKEVGSARETWQHDVLYTDAIKCSGKHTNIRAQFGTVFSGKENCADLNNYVNDVKLTAERWAANGGLYPFTIKGGASNVGIYGKLDGHGTECDIDAGNHSDQSSTWVTDWELGLTSIDGAPITIRCLLAETPRLVPGTGPYKFLFPDPRV